MTGHGDSTKMGYCSPNGVNFHLFGTFLQRVVDSQGTARAGSWVGIRDPVAWKSHPARKNGEMGDFGSPFTATHFPYEGQRPAGSISPARLAQGTPKKHGRLIPCFRNPNPKTNCSWLSLSFSFPLPPPKKGKGSCVPFFLPPLKKEKVPVFLSSSPL